MKTLLILAVWISLSVAIVKLIEMYETQAQYVMFGIAVFMMIMTAKTVADFI